MRLVLLLLVLVAPSASAQPDPFGRALPIVRLTEGQTDTLVVADLLGPIEGTPHFASTEQVSVAHEEAAGTLSLTPREGISGITTLPFTFDGEAYALAIEIRVPTTHTFTFTPDLSTPDAPMPEVFVIGGFNDWARGLDQLTDSEGDGTLRATLAIEPGRYEYKFTVDGEEVLDLTNPDSVLNPFGAYNNLLTVRPAAEGALRIHPLSTGRLATFGFLLYAAATATRPDGRAAPPPRLRPDDIIAFANNRPVQVSCERGHEENCIAGRFSVSDIGELSYISGPYTVRLAAQHNGLVSPWVEVLMIGDRSLGMNQVDGGTAFVWQDAILYQIMIDRFANGDPSRDAPVRHPEIEPPANYHGGDLQGILDKIEEGYFTDLGVNVLWLSPVYANPQTAYQEFPPPHRYYSGYHGYWPVEPRAVDPRFGDLALLRRVVSAAHERGLKVLLDFVANHTHENHPYFREHRDWFGTLELPNGSLNLRRWDDYRLTTWFEPYLPSFDFEGSQGALEQVTADAVWWLRETGADGFRHDAVKHIPNTFWRRLTERLHQELASERAIPIYQIGETFGSYDLISSYVNPGQLTAQFNFNLYDAALATFLNDDSDFANLATEMEKTLAVYGPLHVMGNLMDSHDKPRFLALADGDLPPGTDDKELGWTDPPVVDDPASYRRAELYLAYLLTIPGVPTIYYGDEIGMTGANDPDNRRMMRFGEDITPAEQRMNAAVRRLIHLRRDHPALRHGTFETLRAEGALWAYLRATPQAAMLVVLNKGDQDQTLTLDGLVPTVHGFSGATDALTKTVLADPRLAIPAGGYRVVALRR
ncbi:MAG: DUF3459 domain-containing protein [Rhodothermaceae bacterium]|nr:DUF3459 domain-containing protein [Rhodothermaceae bacterium]